MKCLRKTFSLFLALIMVFSVVSVNVSAANITTPATGYTKASDVVYKISSGRIANWGARGEVATFLTTYTNDYYKGEDTFDSLSKKSGGHSAGDAYQSTLYRELADLMASSQTFYTYYDGNKNVREFYKYTDCIKSDTSKVALIYDDQIISSTWNGGSTWNQEHVWPKSKLNTSEQIGDIMHLRACDPGQNSGRGNTPYGESGGYYDPGESVRGDCARTILFMYVRWGVTSTMWGKSGVIENVDVLLRWIEEDPVDTWELGRNDSVQSITGVRNVFIDYPEYAWLLFGEAIPKNMPTPSGEAKEIGTGTGSTSSSGSTTSSGSASSSGSTASSGSSAATPSTPQTVCKHTSTTLINAVSANCRTEGYSGDVVCNTCGFIVTKGHSTNRTAHISNDGNYICDICGAAMDCIHKNIVTVNQKPASCNRDGYSGDDCCEDCHEVIRQGFLIPKTNNHTFGEWQTPAGGDDSVPKQRVCSTCGLIETESVAVNADTDHKAMISKIVVRSIIIIVVSLILIGGIVSTVIIVYKKH